MTQQYSLASTAVWPFPPQSPPWRPLKLFPHSQQQTLPWDCSQSIGSSSQLPHIQRTCVLVQGRERGCPKDCLCGSHSIQTVIDQLLHSPAASTVPTYCPAVRIWLMLQFPYTLDAGSVFITLLFPLSCQFLHQSIHSFSVVRDSCPLSSVFWENFCNWRCIPDASSMKRCTHTHLLLQHTLPMAVYCWIWLANILLKTLHQNSSKPLTFLYFFFVLFLFVSVWKQCWPHKILIEKFPFSSIFRRVWRFIGILLECFV